MEKTYYVYIMSNKKRGVLYIGITGHIERRIYEHKNELIKGFTEKYKTKKLVHCELFSNVLEALEREKQLKKWHREWKINLIEETNPEWVDLMELSTIKNNNPLCHPELVSGSEVER